MRPLSDVTLHHHHGYHHGHHRPHCLSCVELRLLVIAFSSHGGTSAGPGAGVGYAEKEEELEWMT